MQLFGLRKTPELSLALPQALPLVVTGSVPATGGRSGPPVRTFCQIFWIQGRNRSAAQASGEGRGTLSHMKRSLRSLHTENPHAKLNSLPTRDIGYREKQSASPLTRRASDDARRPLPAKERGEVIEIHRTRFTAPKHLRSMV